MKKLTYLLAILALNVCIGKINAQEFLKAQNKSIVRENGERIILRGMGLGGWMLQEGYMFGLADLGQQYRIKEAITKTLGNEKTAQFYQKWLANHTTKADIDSMAAWGFNSIRLPMHYRLYTLSIEEEPIKGKQTWLEEGFTLTDSLLSWCKANGVYLILDLHAAPGGQGNDLPIADRNPDLPSLWESTANQDKTVALWGKLAERYANEPMIGGYDLLNETNWGFEDVSDKIGNKEQKNEPLRKLFIRITQEIRRVDKKHMIILEGNAFANNYKGIEPNWDDNMVISFHKYGNFADVASIQHFLDLREQYNLPLWLGEAGENANTWFTNTIRLMEDQNIGWSWWPNKKLGINNPLSVKRPEGYDQVVNAWTKDEKLPDNAAAILNELGDNLHVKRNVIHKDVIDAMFRQVNDWTTIPFKQHLLNKELRILAVDYDLGRNNAAYFDNDSCSYRFVNGINTTGNKGSQYRNDGVDIKKDKSGDGFHIFSIEDNEWLLYTINVKNAGKYTLTVEASSEGSNGILSIEVGQQKNEVAITETPDSEWNNYDSGSVFLEEGANTIKVVAEKGGFLLKAVCLKQ